LGIDTFATYSDGRSLLRFADRIRAFSRFKPPFISVAAMADFLQAQARLDRMARRVPLDAPWAADRAERWDATTVATWLNRHTTTSGGRALMELAITSVLAAEPSEVSLLHLLFYQHSSGGSRSLMNAQRWRFAGGSHLISQRLADTLRGEVVLASPVRSIRTDDEGVEVHLDGDDATLRGKRAVITAPPSLAGRIRFDPPLSAERDQLMQSAPMGSSVKFLAVYPEPFWRAQGLNGQASSTTGPVRVMLDNSPPSGHPGVLVGLSEAGSARALRRLDPLERRRRVLEVFEAFFGDRAREPIEFVEQDWNAEEWSRGCYGAFFPPGVWTTSGHTLRRPEGRIHWAGSKTSRVWAGYMEGAVRSGRRVATEVTDHLNAG
jgi:monoamine oxidase